MHQNYLKSAIAQFEYYKALSEKTFIQLNDEQLLWQYNKESNSIAIIVKHMVRRSGGIEKLNLKMILKIERNFLHYGTKGGNVYLMH